MKYSQQDDDNEERFMATVSSLEQSGHLHDESWKNLLLERHREGWQATSEVNEDTIPVPGSFDFIWQGSQHPIALIRTLKYGHLPNNPGTFCIYDPIWSEELLLAIMDVFFYFAKNKIYWNTLGFGHYRVQPQRQGQATYDGSSPYCCFESKFMQPILLIAHVTGLFKRFELQNECWQANIYSSSMEEASFMFGMEWNTRLESISLQITRAMPKGDERALCRALERSKTLKEITIRCATAVNFKLLCQGLEANTTLSRIELSFRHPNTTTRSSNDDGANSHSIGTMLEVLAKHPNLKTLQLGAGYRFGDYSTELGRLLATSKSLKDLTLMGCSSDKRFLDTERMLEGLRASRSLRKLRIVGCLTGDLVFFKILQMLNESKDCPLQVLALGNLISENDLLFVQRRLPRLHRPVQVEFDCRNRGTIFDHRRWKAVLLKHPEIRLFVGDAVISDSFKYIADLNWFGRYLVVRKPPSISLWPKILEHANHKPSVIYEWLKGPAFAARDHGYDDDKETSITDDPSNLERTSCKQKQPQSIGPLGVYTCRRRRNNAYKNGARSTVESSIAFGCRQVPYLQELPRRIPSVGLC